jgi:hypothetical protein
MISDLALAQARLSILHPTGFRWKILPLRANDGSALLSLEWGGSGPAELAVSCRLLERSKRTLAFIISGMFDRVGQRIAGQRTYQADIASSISSGTFPQGTMPLKAVGESQGT